MSKLPDGDIVLLLDASSYIHRSFHASPRMRRRADEQETGAIISMCWSMMRIFHLNRTALRRRPSHAAIFLDSRSKNFRHAVYPSYKANRQPYDPALESQLPFIPQIAKAFGIRCIGTDGWEADDIVATYANMAAEEGKTAVIASSDKDFCQIVSDQIFMYDAMKDKEYDYDRNYDTSGAIIDIDAVKAKWGVFPWRMADLQALTGDAVDNIPGVPSIGPKSAAALLEEFDSLDEMISEAEWGEVSRFKNAKQMALIEEYRENIEISRNLVELRIDVPVRFDISDLYLGAMPLAAMREFFMSLEAPQLARRI